MDYYYRNNQQQEEGPLPEEILREWLKLGQINESTYVRRCDSGVWMPAADAFCAPKGPAVLLSPSPSVPDEPSASPLNNVKARFIGGAVLALLAFIAYQKSQRGNALAPQQPVATQPQPHQTGANLEASHQLVRTGLAHLYGIQCPVNIAEANRCFDEAWNGNDACGAFWRITMIYGTQTDFDKEKVNAAFEAALTECRNQAAGGDPLAKLCVGCFDVCSSDANVKQGGMKLLFELADGGDVVALVEFGKNLSQTENDTEAQQTGFALLKELSDKRTVRADRYLAYCYLNGLGTAKDFEKVSQLMHRAADNGDPWAIDFIKQTEQ